MFRRRATESRHSVRGRRHGRALLSIAAVSALTLTAACGSGSGAGGGGDSLQIGILAAETGPLAGGGKAFLSGAMIAQAQVNENDVIGNGKKIELVKKESAEDPARSASVAGQLASNQKILGSICCILSPVAGAVKPVVKRSKMPLIIYGATEPDMAEPPYVIRTTTMPHPANEEMTKQIAEKSKVKSVSYVVMTDNDGIVSQGEAFKKGFDDAGVKDLGQVGIVGKQSNFTSSAAKVMQKDPEAIVVAATQAEAVGMIGALHDKGYKGQIITGETVVGAGVFKSNPDALEDVPFPVYYLASETTPEGEAFAKAYKKKYGTEPDDFAAQGYNSVYTMAVGLSKAGKTPTRESLAKALAGLKSVDKTIYGTVTFEGGQLSATSSMKIVHYSKPDGEIVPWTGF